MAAGDPLEGELWQSAPCSDRRHGVRALPSLPPLFFCAHAHELGHEQRRHPAGAAGLRVSVHNLVKRGLLPLGPSSDVVRGGGVRIEAANAAADSKGAAPRQVPAAALLHLCCGL